MSSHALKNAQHTITLWDSVMAPDANLIMLKYILCFLLIINLIRLYFHKKQSQQGLWAADSPFCSK